MKALLCQGGGMDSATVTALHRNDIRLAITFDYQQPRHELTAAARIANHYGIPHTIQPVTLPVTALTAGLPPTGLPWDHPDQAPIVVPNRTAIFANLCAAWAVAYGLDTVLLGVQYQGAGVIPDSHPDFIAALNNLICTATEEAVHVVAPLNRYSKEEIAALGTELGVPWDLTRSCYADTPDPCGECAACLKRAEGFDAANLNDPGA